MLLHTNHRCRQSVRSRVSRARRGSALVFVLVFVVAFAALAMGSIYMASNSNLLAKSYDRERELKFASEMALAMGKSRVNNDPSILVMGATQLDTAILLGQTLTGADSKPIPGIKVNVYVGPTGSTSGQFGRFASIVAEARDDRGNGFIRRLELTQESFAKFAYWSNSETNNGTTIYFNNGDELWGPVWSNDNINIGSGGAIFHSQVATAGVINGKSYGTYPANAPPLERQTQIKLPTTTALAKFQTLAASGGWSLADSVTPSNNETSVRNRIEFLAADLNRQNDSTDFNEGFFRYYTAYSGNDKYLRGDWPGTSSTAPSASNVKFCGDFHWAPKDTIYANSGDGVSHLRFYPVSVHSTVWFRDQIKQGYVDHYGWAAQTALDSANAEQAQSLKGILDNPGARCYLAGDPHLVAVDRATTIKDPATGVNYTTAAMQKGGTDTTFTPTGVYGYWMKWTSVPADTIKKYRPWDGMYLVPIDRSFTSNAKGVIFVPGNVGVSGVLNGRITLYAKGTIILLDDLRYANDPVKGVCHDILGMISDKDIVIADNTLNDPPPVDPSSKTAKYYSLDDTKDFYLHAVLMALGTSFRVENFDSGPTDTNDCNAVNNGRGCIYLSGGIIQQSRGAVGTSIGTGFTKRYSYDHCAVVNPPPFFPTTGRFMDNRYLELDPVGFNATAYFQTLTPSP